MIVYKIVAAGEWREAESAGVFAGAAVDRADGFIHFSTAEQAPETAAKWFAGRTDLTLAAVDAAAGKVPENETGEEMVEAAVYESRSEARLAKSFLLSAEIPCELENELALNDAPLRLLVPASLLDQALDVLSAEISEEELAAQAEAAGEQEGNS